MRTESNQRFVLAFTPSGSAFIGDERQLKEQFFLGQLPTRLSCQVSLDPLADDTVWQVTARGVVKCTRAREFKSANRKTGIRGIDIDEDDRLVAVFCIPEKTRDTNIVIATVRGIAIRFSVDEVCPMIRTARGVCV